MRIPYPLPLPITASKRGWTIACAMGGERGITRQPDTLSTMAIPLGALIAISGFVATGARSPAIGLWPLAAQAPDGGRSVFALLVALLAGTLAWLTATIVAKPASPPDSRYALRASLALALLAPAMAPLLVLPIGIAIVERRPALGMAVVAALVLAIGGRPVYATLALIAAGATLIPPPAPVAANDNGRIRPLPYRPWRPFNTPSSAASNRAGSST